MARVFDCDRLLGAHLEAIERRQVEAGVGLGERGVLPADDALPPVGKAQPFEMADHPSPAGAGGDRQLETGFTGPVAEVDHPGQHRPPGQQLLGAAAAQDRDRVPVERAAQPGFEVGVGVEGVGAHGRLPELQRELLAVLPVDLGVGQVDRLLGLQDQAVEIEDDRAQHPICLAP
jgi:hypothetical protein